MKAVLFLLLIILCSCDITAEIGLENKVKVDLRRLTLKKATEVILESALDEEAREVVVRVKPLEINIKYLSSSKEPKEFSKFVAEFLNEIRYHNESLSITLQINDLTATDALKVVAEISGYDVIVKEDLIEFSLPKQNLVVDSLVTDNARELIDDLLADLYPPEFDYPYPPTLKRRISHYYSDGVLYVIGKVEVVKKLHEINESNQ